MSSSFVPIEKAVLDWSGGLPFSSLFDDVYHSSESGIGQSRHVFIDGNDLIARWSKAPSLFTIGETGFGTGLNFLLTWFLWEQYAPKTSQLHFYSCEKHPLNKTDLQKCFALWPELSKQAQQLLAQYPVLTPGYHRLIFCEGRIRLTLMLGDVIDCYEQLLISGEPQLESELRVAFIDAWYLDGFSPAKNESMWNKTLFTLMAMLSKKGSTLATYTAAGVVKTALREAGFQIVKRTGFGIKRHMIVGEYSGYTSLKIKKRHTPWHVNTPVRTDKTALIIGGGLAGCFVANTLAKRGWLVTLLEEKEQLSQGGSANSRAVLFPKLSAYKSPLTQFMLDAFLYAIQVYQRLLSQHPIGELKGSMILAHNKREQQAQEALKLWLTHYPELGQLVDPQLASQMSGIELSDRGVFIPDSGWLDMPALCHILIQHENINVIQGLKVASLNYHEGIWEVEQFKAPVLILATADKVNQFEETKHLPIKCIRGQMSMVEVNTMSDSLKIPVCADGHVLPAYEGLHACGASYELDYSDPYISSKDDEENLHKLLQIAPQTIWNTQIMDHWAGIRASTSDYLPLVGPVARAEEFIKQFSGLQSNAKRWIPKPGVFYPGLYVCAGFGSRGLTSIPLCAEFLASLINRELSSLPRVLVQSLSPARFLRKNIIRGMY